MSSSHLSLRETGYGNLADDDGDRDDIRNQNRGASPKNGSSGTGVGNSGVDDVLGTLTSFSHHFLPDMRWGLFALSVVLFGRAWFQFTADLKPRRMPMLMGFLLVALFIWFAENVGTFTSTWVYPHQGATWLPVSLAKLGSWYLLMMLSFVLVSIVHRPEPVEIGARATSGSRNPGTAGAASGRS